MKNYTLVCVAQGHVELQELEARDPVGNEIQVQVHASAISPGTERAAILRLANTGDSFPRGIGYCAAGVVTKVAAGVTRFQVGDRVAAHGIRHGSVGNITGDWAVHIPDNVPFEQACFLSLGVIATQGVRKARLELGEGALVFGLGLIGQLAAQLVRLSGAFPVIGVDRVRSRLRLARECGADAAFDTNEAIWADRVRAYTAGQGPQVVVESTGFPDVIGLSLQAVRNFGRVVLLGSTRGDSTVNFYKDVHKKAVTIVGAHIDANPKQESRPGFWTWQDEARCFMALLQSARVSLQPLITEQVHWSRVQEVYKEIMNWNADMIGTVIKWH